LLSAIFDACGEIIGGKRPKKARDVAIEVSKKLTIHKDKYLQKYYMPGIKRFG